MSMRTRFAPRWERPFASSKPSASWRRATFFVPLVLACTSGSLLPLGLEGQSTVVPGPAGGGGTPQETEALGRLRSGDYEGALETLEALSRRSDAPVSARRLYAGALLEVGRHQEAIRVAGGEGSSGGRLSGARSVELENLLGEALYAVGRVAEAEEAFQRAIQGGASDRHVARLNLGVLEWNRGERDAALAIFDSFIDLYNGSRGSLSVQDLMAVGVAVRYLGVTNPDLYKDALLAFEDAAAADPAHPGPSLLQGELFLEKYLATDARQSFGEVLDRNPRDPRALLGQARILDFEGAGGAVETVRKALEVNPRYVQARTLLALLLLKTENEAGARQEAEEALKVNPVDLGALTALAASYYLADEPRAYEEVRKRIHDIHPTYGDLYTTLAQLAVAQRRYGEAAELAERAVALEPDSWQGYGLLGLNQLRLGAVEEGRESLEKAFAGDPYNPWYKNTLDLLDRFVHFQRVDTEHFQIYLHEREAALLGPYVKEVAEESYRALKARYGAEPPTPIRLEIYPSHADFSVRTLGVPGLGALGVSFGSTLVMDSPSAQEAGDFNWESTLWHEVAHAFHLAMTDHRVPRWFTEGLAVHEQRVARARWGHHVNPGWLQAYARGRLHPVSRLNEGFIRPQFPEEVVFSYYHASLVFGLIEDRWGREAILAMLDAYREGKSDDEVFRSVLGMNMDTFDTTFDTYVRERWGARMAAVSVPEEGQGLTIYHPEAGDLEGLRLWVLENPANFMARLALGRGYFEAERFEEAEREFRAAINLFPEYGGRDSPYLYLAGVQRERGQLREVAETLRQLGELSETLYPVHAEEAELWLELGDTASATRALEDLLEITPFDVEAHRTLAGLLEADGAWEEAVVERRAILALDPADRADAHFRLAFALHRAGKADEARSQVLRALEIAPNYEEALELLLAIRGGNP